jgi:hypothetical protein
MQFLRLDSTSVQCQNVSNSTRITRWYANYTQMLGDLWWFMCHIPHILLIMFIGLAYLLVLPRIQVLPHALISSNGTMAKNWRNPTDPTSDKKPARGEDPESSWAKLVVHWFPQVRSVLLPHTLFSSIRRFYVLAGGWVDEHNEHRHLDCHRLPAYVKIVFVCVCYLAYLRI